jgi:hypothetical protein
LIRKAVDSDGDESLSVEGRKTGELLGDLNEENAIILIGVEELLKILLDIGADLPLTESTIITEDVDFDPEEPCPETSAVLILMLCF